MAVTLGDLCASAIASYPDAMAVTYDDGQKCLSLTYRDVNTAAERICSALREHGAHREVIGLAVEMSVEIPSLLLGISRVPAAFYTAMRSSLRHVINKKHIVFFIVDALHKDEVIDSLQLKSSDYAEILIEGMDVSVLRMNAESRKHRDDLAFVITTSGTTGNPKIVSVPHQCIVPNVLCLRSLFELGTDDLVFMASPLTFDPSIVEVFMTLSSGAALLIVPHKIKMNPAVLNEMLTHKHPVTVIQATPTLISRFGSTSLQEGLLSDTSRLRVLALGGETCPSTATLRTWRCPGNKTRFYNLYGVTEVSCWATCFHISEDYMQRDKFEVPLGLPLSGTVIEVHGDDDQVITTGCGNIFIGGRDRRCYLDEEEGVLSDKAIMLRDSGDVALVTASGQLFYRGRRDNQIKRFGKRLNLIQLEKVILDHDQVEQCCAVSEDQALYVFVTTWSEEKSNHDDKRILEFIKKRLPDQYTPDTIIAVKTFPVTAHGKVDKRKLLKLLHDQNSETSDNMQEIIGNAWASSLGLTDSCAVDRDRNFVQCGGTSFSALQFIEKLQQQFNINFPPPLLEIILEKTFNDVVSHVSHHCLNQSQADTPVMDDESPASSYDYSPANKKSRLFDLYKSDANDLNQAPSSLSIYKVSLFRSGGTFSISRGSRIQLGCCPPYKSYEDETSAESDVKNDLTHHHQTTEMSHMKSVTSDIVIDGDLNMKTKRQFCVSEKWKVDSGKCVDASPLLVCRPEENGGDVVYIGSHSHKFLAISLPSGDVLWKQHVGDRVESSACLSLCARFVVVGCYDGKVYVFDATTGVEWWTYQTQGQVKSSPCVDLKTGHVFIGSHDRHLYAFNVELCQCIWRVDLSSGSVFSSPCLSYTPYQLYAVTLAGDLTALRPTDGAVIWQYSCGAAVFSSVCDLSGAVCVGTVDGTVHCVSTSGVKLWTFKTDKSIFSSACPLKMRNSGKVKECIVIGSHDQCVYCLDVADGSLLWKSRLNSPVYSTPFLMTVNLNECSLEENAQQTSTVEKCESEKHSKEISYNEVSLPYLISPETKSINRKSTDKMISENDIEKGERNIDSCGGNKNIRDMQIKTDSFYYTSKSLTRNGAKQTGNGSNSPKNGGENHMIVGCSSSGTVYLLNPADGTIVTEWILPGEVFSSPVALDNLVIVGCRDNNIVCGVFG